MSKDIVGIKLKGGNFSTETKLLLFGSNKDKEVKVSLVYGKNGSGKSTISRAFNKLKGCDEQYISTVEAIDSDENVITLTEDEKKQMYIFNEDYIDNNIRLHEENLETIVVLGEQKNIDDELNKIQQEQTENQKKVTSQKAICDVYNDATNIISPEYHKKRMLLSLKGEGNWADRDSKIKGNKMATAIKSDAFLKFVNRNPKRKRDELVEEFNIKFAEYEKAKKGQKIIDVPVKTNYHIFFNEEEYISLLAQRIEEPNLSDREKFLLSLLADKGQTRLKEIKTFFYDKEHNTCPYCLQHVSEDHKKQLFSSIEKVLSKKTEEHQSQLDKFQCNEIQINFEPYKDLNEEIVKKCLNCLNEFNYVISIINDNIAKKKDNVYTPIVIEKIGFISKLDALINSLKLLEAARLEFNKNASNMVAKSKELKNINDDIAYYDIIESYETYSRQLEVKQKEDKKLETYNSKLEECKKKIMDLEAQKRNIHIAKDFINNSLQYIFFTENRLSIEYKNDKYYLLSRGKSVTPKEISVGERNAIALCYFFSDIMQNKEKDNIYDNKYLLVIDDPVSSFDIDNRVGILSFLKYQLQSFLCGNADTKALIMTHDIQILYDIDKLINEIMSAFNDKLEKSQRKISVQKELTNQNLKNFALSGRHEYTSLLECIYDYALGKADEYEIFIGNSMRRVLEAFSTFLYKKDIQKISTQSEIIKDIDSAYKKYFEHLMYRLVLNGGSHTSENVKALRSMDFFDYISSDEKKRTAKDVLCFMYCLNDVHILEHLSQKDGAENTIETWLVDIKNEQIF